MGTQPKKIAVIGAGISGVVAAAHLIKEGLDVTVLERSSVAGGVWTYDERLPIEPEYDIPNPTSNNANTNSNATSNVLKEETATSEILHAPPGPCYVGLQNNVGTRMLQTTLNPFPPGTPDVVSHRVLAEYIRDTSVKTGVHDVTRYNTSVRDVRKEGEVWRVESTSLEKEGASGAVVWDRHSSHFTHIVVASGHYHDPRIPPIPNLSRWKRRWPTRIQHSKRYRDPAPFAGKTVLLIGASVSSTDIARELGPVAHRVYQTHRHGAFDLPASMLPANAVRVDDVAAFDEIPDDNDDDDDGTREGVVELGPDDAIPLNVTLTSGRTLCGIHHVILCTGYHITLPFLSSYCIPTPTPTPTTSTDEASETTLLTGDGLQIHNLHKDIFYIPDPSLFFIGVPYFTATFTLFEFQAMIAAKVVAGKVALPTEDEMRSEYVEKVRVKGLGKGFHSLKGEEEAYVDGLVAWANRDLEGGGRGGERLSGHTEVWRVARGELVERMRRLVEEEGVGVGREVVVRC